MFGPSHHQQKSPWKMFPPGRQGDWSSWILRPRRMPGSFTKNPKGSWCRDFSRGRVWRVGILLDGSVFSFEDQSFCDEVNDIYVKMLAGDLTMSESRLSSWWFRSLVILAWDVHVWNILKWWFVAEARPSRSVAGREITMSMTVSGMQGMELWPCI